MTDQGTEPRITVADAAAIELGPWTDKPDDLGPDMRALVLWRAPDSAAITGVWECDPGTFRVDFGPAGEFAQFLSRHVTCRSDDGDTFELREGDVMTFVPGWSGEWTAHSRLRKIYCTFVPGVAG
jgi:uncharacterized protein